MGESSHFQKGDKWGGGGGVFQPCVPIQMCIDRPKKGGFLSPEHPSGTSTCMLYRLNMKIGQDGLTDKKWCKEIGQGG